MALFEAEIFLINFSYDVIMIKPYGPYTAPYTVWAIWYGLGFYDTKVVKMTGKIHVAVKPASLKYQFILYWIH